MLTEYITLDGIDLDRYSINIIAHRVQQSLRQNCPKRSGRMCNSIHVYPFPKQALLLVKVEVVYAGYQDRRTSHAGWFTQAVQMASSIINEYRLNTLNRYYKEVSHV